MKLLLLGKDEGKFPLLNITRLGTSCQVLGLISGGAIVGYGRESGLALTATKYYNILNEICQVSLQLFIKILE